MRYLAIFCLFFSSLFSKEKICLNMIVKDESAIIKRCLDSVKPYIDYWVIVDTGSKDGTQKIIKNHMKDIPGKLYERPWKNWGENRSEALKLAQGNGDYILFMDADDILKFHDKVGFENLTKDEYCMWRGRPGFTYLKAQLVKNGLPWKWVGLTHEYLDCDKPYSQDILTNVSYISIDDGATRKDPKKKFQTNVDLLVEGLKKEPSNARYMFYLAESYRDLGEKGKALEAYQKRIAMGGWAEEVFYSMLQSAHILRDLGLSSNVVKEAYMTAKNYRPHRCEPTYYLAEIYMNEYQQWKAYDLITSSNLVLKPSHKDTLFNSDWIEDYGFAFQLSICAYYIGKERESVVLCDALLKNPNLPETWKKQTEINRKLSLAKLEAAAAKK